MNGPQDLAPTGPQPADPRRLIDDQLITIADIRKIFGLGRTAAYELTHRPDFPGHIRVTSRCYRWWASEVDAYANALRRERAQPSSPRTTKPNLPDPAVPPRSISGTVRAARTGRKQGS